MIARRPLVAGNWKMNGLSASSATLDAIIGGATKLPGNVDVLVCPPFLLIRGFAAQAWARSDRDAGGGVRARTCGSDGHAVISATAET